jgi:tetratricopeptide (TPR) repeat protein
VTTRSRGRARPSGRPAAALVLALLSLAACTKPSAQGTGNGGEGGASADAAPAAAAEGDLPGRPRTTSWSIAGDNLDADIAERLRRDQPDGPNRLTLVELLLARGQFVSNVADYELADSISAKAVASLPASPDAHFARALAHGALHRFEAELSELDKAKTLGAAEARVASARAGVLIATGRYDEADALLPQAGPNSRPADLVTRAVLLGHMQRLDDAEHLFARARAETVDVSPFPVAWMDFQRATLLASAGRTTDARRYFREAAQVIPVYVHAGVHLAPTDAPTDARVRLEALRKTSSDPEILAALASAYRSEHNDEDASRVAGEARARYDELVASHPEAYADHAARFYLGAGDDPKKACELAEKNATLRPTEEAIDLWMAAAAALDDKPKLCASAGAMKALPYASEMRKRLAAATSAGCPTAAPK